MVLGGGERCLLPGDEVFLDYQVRDDENLVATWGFSAVHENPVAAALAPVSPVKSPRAVSLPAAEDASSSVARTPLKHRTRAGRVVRACETDEVAGCRDDNISTTGPEEMSPDSSKEEESKEALGIMNAPSSSEHQHISPPKFLEEYSQSKESSKVNLHRLRKGLSKHLQ